MHIPDGYLGLATYGAMFAVTVPCWGARVGLNTSSEDYALLAGFGYEF